MKNLVIIDKADIQYKGNLHLHTNRSRDCKYPYLEVFQELKDKGCNFTLVSDHEIYGDSIEGHTDTFVTLPGTEMRSITEYRYSLKEGL